MRLKRSTSFMFSVASLHRADEQLFIPVLCCTFELGSLGLGQELPPGLVLRPFEGCDGAQVPDSLEVRLTPCGPYDRGRRESEGLMNLPEAAHVLGISAS